jgi:D-amino-acid dehydrogenase
MKIVILGSGALGLTNAWYLAEAGHEVTVLDRHPGSRWIRPLPRPGRSHPVKPRPSAASGIPLKAVKWMVMRHSALFIRHHLDPAQAWPG